MKEGEGEGGRRLPRRQALLLLAGMPQVLLGLGSGGGGWGWEWEGMKEGRVREEVLPVVAGSITACWHLLNEGELEAVERTVGSYLPLLRRWAYEPSGVQREAAYLAAQACLLYSLVEHHRLRFQQRWRLTQEAVVLSRLSAHRLLLVETLTELGVASYWCGLPAQMLEAYLEAESLMEPLPALSKNIVLRGLARAYAQQGQEREALKMLSAARLYAVEDSYTEETPIFLAAQEGYHMHMLYAGFVHLELGRYGRMLEHCRSAEQALGELDGWRRPVPVRLRLEIVNRRGEAAIGRGELEEYVSYTVEGAEGARRLGSGKRRQELVSNWKRALERWPGEKRVRELGELVLSG
ncbi:hypothetical protein [Thermogemmatispora onikobensis]|uniref:hypothetical protein n=1 Tax=Thermogemmatispora onikobensis TaxID=732234 RepID=UPI000853EE14|nr:hypothetical protein [Thermogemmatispora onikobensis]